MGVVVSGPLLRLVTWVLWWLLRCVKGRNVSGLWRTQHGRSHWFCPKMTFHLICVPFLQGEKEQ